MLLTLIQNCWNLFLLFIFVFLPICFIVAFFNEIGKTKKEEAKEEIQEIKEEQKKLEFDLPVIENYRTVKKEPGSYLVVAPDGTEAVVVKGTMPGEGKVWIAALAVKNNKNSARASTKKEAVALAIEMLKEFKSA